MSRNKNLKKLLIFFEENIVIFKTAFIILVALFLYLILLLVDKTSQKNNQLITNTDLNQPYVWGGVIPGQSRLQEVESNLGEFLGESNEFPPYTVRNYDLIGSGNPAFVYINKMGIVEYISIPEKEFLPGTYDKLKNDLNLGEPDLLLQEKTADSQGWEGSPFLDLKYVYLDNGVTVVSDRNMDTVFRVEYFVPTSREDFMSKWGRNMVPVNPQ